MQGHFNVTEKPLKDYLLQYNNNCGLVSSVKIMFNVIMADTFTDKRIWVSHCHCVTHLGGLRQRKTSSQFLFHVVVDVALDSAPWRRHVLSVVDDVTPPEPETHSSARCYPPRDDLTNNPLSDGQCDSPRLCIRCCLVYIRGLRRFSLRTVAATTAISADQLYAVSSTSGDMRKRNLSPPPV